MGRDFSKSQVCLVYVPATSGTMLEINEIDIHDPWSVQSINSLGTCIYATNRADCFNISGTGLVLRSPM